MGPGSGIPGFDNAQYRHDMYNEPEVDDDAYAQDEEDDDEEDIPGPVPEEDEFRD
jgi:hypothetical protein